MFNQMDTKMQLSEVRAITMSDDKARRKYIDLAIQACVKSFPQQMKEAAEFSTDFRDRQYNDYGLSKDYNSRNIGLRNTLNVPIPLFNLLKMLIPDIFTRKSDIRQVQKRIPSFIPVNKA